MVAVGSCMCLLISRGGWNKDKEEDDIDKCGQRILNFMSHIQFLGLGRCLKLLERLPYMLCFKLHGVHTLAK